MFQRREKQADAAVNLLACRLMHSSTWWPSCFKENPTAGFRCWPGHMYSAVKGLRALFEESLLRANERELGWLILFPTVTSSIQVIAWPRTGTAAWSEDEVCRSPWFLRLSVCKIQPELILEASADFRGQSYQPDSLTTILRKIPCWLHNLELTVCLRHHLIP